MWSELGHSQLEANEVGDAIESYLRSADHSRHLEVIQRSTQAGAHAQLVKYLLMVRKKVKESKVLPIPTPEAAGAPPLTTHIPLSQNRAIPPAMMYQALSNA